jgi:hypothetical protein
MLGILNPANWKRSPDGYVKENRPQIILAAVAILI